MSQVIFKNGCGDCKRAYEDPTEKYVCPKLKQHGKEYEEWEAKNVF